MASLQLTTKTNRSLQIILFLFLLLLFRIWHLTVLQKEERLKESRKPQERSIALPSPRGIIEDRNLISLAVNHIRYDAAICYAQIRQIPTILWQQEGKKEKVKTFPRKEYIKKLSLFLASELGLNAEDLEDYIHAKASLFPHTPFVIKENISESEYYKLSLLERHWTGLHALISFERHYPHGPVASDILGYLGSFSEEEYWSLFGKIQELQTFLEEEENGEDPPLAEGYRNREEILLDLARLKERAASMHELIGKGGLEKRFEEHLRGIPGKRAFEVDVNGNFLRQLAQSKEPTPGKSLICSISLELQRFAEALLAEDEKSREGKSFAFDPVQKKRVCQKQPLLKGGAIVALDPNNGEVLALASYPRFNPNDFIPSALPSLRQQRQKRAMRWLEHPSYVANLWDGKEKMQFEYYSRKKKDFTIEERELTWEFFCETILPKDSSVKEVLDHVTQLKNAVSIQEDVESLLYFSGQKNAAYLFDLLFVEEEGNILTKEQIPETIGLLVEKNLQQALPEVLALKKRLLSFLHMIPENQNKLFFIDLCRLAVHSPSFSNELLEKVGDQSISSYWQISRAKSRVEEEIYTPIFSLFHTHSFKQWRHSNEKQFIKQKREMEKREKRYAKPWIDYLQEEEKRQFEEFWRENRMAFLLFLLKGETIDIPEISCYLQRLSALSLQKEDLSLLRKSLSSLSSSLALEYLRSFRSFQELDRPLLFLYPSLPKSACEKDLASSFYQSQSFGVSFAYRHGAPLGSIFKIVTGYAALKERYQSLPNSTIPILNPFTFIEELSYDPRSDKKKSLILGHDLHGKAFPQHYKGGRLAKSLNRHAGKIDLIGALEQSSNPYFSILASDYLESPTSLLHAAKEFGFGEKTSLDLPGETSGTLPADLCENRTGLYSFAIGQHTLLATPIQTAVMLAALANGGKVLKPQILKDAPLEIQNEIFLPPSIRKTLLEGMDRVVWGEKGGARAAVIKKLSQDPSLYKEYQDLHHQFVGKTSTAEYTFKSDKLPTSKAHKYNDTWFGAISFDPNSSEWEKPELVVVVYLRFGDRGKDAAPLAAQMIKKYRELCTQATEKDTEILRNHQ